MSKNRHKSNKNSTPSLIEIAAQEFLSNRKYTIEGTENISAGELTRVWKKFRDTEHYSNYNDEGWNYMQHHGFQNEFGDRSTAMIGIAASFDDFLLGMVKG